MYARHITVALLPLLTSLRFCKAESSTDQPLADVLKKHENMSMYSDLLHQQFPAILKTFDSYEADTDPVTLLVPSNHAFEQMQYSDILSPAFANNDTAFLKQVIAYHTLGGSWTSKTLNTSFMFLPSMTRGSNFSAVTGGQRVGAVLQPPNPNTTFEHEMVFTSQAGTRSVATFQDISFKGG